MNTLRPVRFKLAWRLYSVGDVITPNGTLRDWLMANGYVEEIHEEKANEADSKARRPTSTETARRGNSQARANRV